MTNKIDELGVYHMELVHELMPASGPPTINRHCTFQKFQDVCLAVDLLDSNFERSHYGAFTLKQLVEETGHGTHAVRVAVEYLLRTRILRRRNRRLEMASNAYGASAFADGMEILIKDNGRGKVYRKK